MLYNILITILVLAFSFAQETVTFEYIGGVQEFTAPTSGTYTFELWGAGGGNSADYGTEIMMGGLGGFVSGTTDLEAGQLIYINVGGTGFKCPTYPCESGGWNGGGGWNGDSNSQPAGTGGGASDIRINGNELGNRIIVAGGGGGSGCCDDDARGGNGGGLQGLVPTTYWSNWGIDVSGGTQTEGGNGGSESFGDPAEDGILGQGGNGQGSSGGGGGGGGGYYGGGGGFINGGAGGSSYFDDVDNGYTEPGIREDNGLVILTTPEPSNDCPSGIYDCEGVCDGNAPIDCPQQSSQMAAYYFSLVTLDGQPLTSADAIIAKNGDSTVVGYGMYENAGSGYTEVYVYGEMNIGGESFGTEGYMLTGQTPQFYVNGSKAHYVAADGTILQDIPVFIPLGNHQSLTLHLISDCNDDMGGAGSLDYCNECYGGATGNDAGYKDTDDDGVCNAGSANGDADNCPDLVNPDQANNDNDANGDFCDDDDDNDGCLDDVDDAVFEWDTNTDGTDTPNDCDVDDDNDGVIDAGDTHPIDNTQCSDVDGDSCDDCSNGTYNPSNDGADNDSDGACDLTDPDDDNDGCNDVVDDEPMIWDDDYDNDNTPDDCDADDDDDNAADAVDSDDNDEFVCNDDDGDTCDECSSGTYDSANDGADNDSDGACDLTDPDDDNDGCLDGDDDAKFEWDDNYDGVDNPDDCDPDDDNDGALDAVDSDDNNENICNDDDGDTCDECSSGSYDSANDGADNDEDGICNDGDSDDDNDGALDDSDFDDNNKFVCNDDDGDSCDECSSGTYNSANDGWDYDGDGACDAGDDDDDNDGEIDALDSADNNENVCHDDDGDTCDECADGSLGGTDDDGSDNDLDGWCNAGDDWPDCPNDVIDSNPYDECANCHGDGFAAICVGTDDCDDMACDGDCDQVAYFDDCGECDDSSNTDCVDIDMDINAGVNLISFNALTSDLSIESIFSSNDFNGNCTIMGEGVGTFNLNGQWIGSLTSVSPADGYWVIVSESVLLSFTDADPISYDADGEVEYNINYGANLISYPFNTTQSLDDALGDASANIYAIVGEGMAAVQMNGGFVGSLETFEGGNGYWLISLESFTFTFNGVESGLSKAEQTIPREVPEFYHFSQSSNQAFYFIESATIKNEPLDFDDIIIAYNDFGIVGSRYWNGEYTDIPVMGIDSNYIDETADYCTEGDHITFKVLDASSGKLVEMDTDTEFTWSNLGTSIVNLVDDKLPSIVSLDNAYPNPFNPSTTLSFSLPETQDVMLQVFNLQGREITTLLNGSMEAGYHSITWNADKHASGVYFIKMITNEYISTQKLILMK